MAQKPLTKGQVSEKLSQSLDITKKQANEFVDAYADLAAREVKRGGTFVMPGIGKVVLAKRKARMGRNPQTGEPLKIPAKTVLRIRVSKQLKDAVGLRKK